MSVSFTAKAQNINFKINQEEVKNFCNDLAINYQWNYENMIFWINQEDLFGGFKISQNILQVTDNLTFAVEILTKSSEKFGISWDISMENPIGKVENGKPDKALSEALSFFTNMKENHLKKANRPKWQPTEKGKKPRATDKKKYKERPPQEGLVTENGLTDLRGNQIDTGMKVLTYDNADLSYSILTGKFIFTNSVLDFIDSQRFEIDFMENCKLIAGKISIILNIKIIEDFSFKNNDFSYSKIEQFSRTLGVRKGAFVEDSCFDFCDFKNLDRLYFKNCSFRNANLNACEILYSTFENCDFTGVSFDSTHFAKTQFISCKGLDRDKMIEYFPILFGEVIGNEEDIIFS